LSEIKRRKSFAAANWLWRSLNCWSLGTAPSSVYASDFMSFVVRKLPLAEQDALDAADRG
jgi:hypothetical protein